MKNALFFAIAAVAALMVSTAQAGDIDIQLQSSTWDVNQVGVSGAVTLAAASVANAEVVNIAGMASVEGIDLDDVTANVSVNDVNQIGVSVAAAIDGYNPSNPVGRATATTTQVAGLVNIDGTNLDATSDILSQNTVVDVNQLAGSLAVTGERATAEVSNLAGVTVIDLDGVPSGADVGNIGLSANDINQLGVSVALAGDIANASVSNLAGVGTVSVNIAD